jgi:hypothetical protein
MAGPFFAAFHSTRHLVIKWQLLATACILAFLGLGFLAFAVDLWLTGYLGPPAAAAATAGLLILVALATVGIAAIVAACAPKTAPPGKGLDAATIADLASTLIDLSQKLDAEVRSSVKPLTIAALVVGCVIGYSPALQRKLKELIG